MNMDFEEIGLESIAAYLRENEYQVEMLSIRTFENDESILQKIIETNADLVGISLYSANKTDVEYFCNTIKNNMPNTKICLGGNMATFAGKELMEENDNIDYIIRGEGEYAFLDLLKCLEREKEFSSVPGLIFKEENVVRVNAGMNIVEEFANMPYPVRDLLKQNNKGVALIATTRGCYGYCSFCSAQVFFKKYRRRKAEDVILEIADIKKEYGIDCFDFIDASFEDTLLHSSVPFELIQQIVESNLEIFYFANFRTNVHKKLSRENIQLLKKSGLFSVLLGVEANNDYDLALYQKSGGVIDNYLSVELFLDEDIFVNTGVINFNPYTTSKALLQNIAFLEKYNIACNFQRVKSKLQVYPGTKIYDIVEKDGLLIPGKEMLGEYIFIEKNIGKLYVFLDNYMATNNDINFFNFHAIKGQLFLYYVRKKAFVKNEMLLYEYLYVTMEKLRSILHYVNNMVAKCFRNLVYLTQTNWTDKLAGEIIYTYINPSELRKLRQEYDVLWKTLLMKVNRTFPNTLNMLTHYITYDK